MFERTSPLFRGASCVQLIIVRGESLHISQAGVATTTNLHSANDFRNGLTLLISITCVS